MFDDAVFDEVVGRPGFSLDRKKVFKHFANLSHRRKIRLIESSAKCRYLKN